MRKIRVFSLLMVILMLLLAIPIPSFAATVRPSDIKNTNVKDDIKILEAYKDYKGTFSKNAELKYCEILEFLEMGYTYDSTKAASYWLYIYNPSGKAIQDKPKENLISIQPGTSKTIKKYQLSFHSKTSDNLFYKFQVLGDNDFEAQVDKNRRQYIITDVELRYEGEADPRTVDCAGLWAFTGYDVGCAKDGKNRKSTLEWKSRNILQVHLDLHDVSWKSKTSDKGIGYQHEISSVYFAVPNEVIKRYGDSKDVYKGLIEVSGYYENYRIKGISTSDSALYNDLLNYSGKFSSISDIPYGFYTEPYTRVDNSGLGTTYWKSFYAFNPDNFWAQFHGIVAHRYDTKLYTFGDVYEGTISGISNKSLKEQINDKIENNTNVFYVGSSDSNYYTVSNKDSNGDVINIMEAMSSLSDIEGEWNFWDWMSGIPAYDEEKYVPVSPLQVVTKSDVESLVYTDEYLASQLYVSEEEFSELESFVKGASSDETVYLLRFAVTDYYNEDIYLCRKGGGDTGSDIGLGNGNYYFEKEIFLNFDILSLTYENENGKRTIVPVQSTPIDIVGNVSTTPPAEDNIIAGVGEIGGNIQKGCQDLSNIKPTIIIISAILLLLILAMFPSLVNLLGKIIAAPFKFADKLIDKSITKFKQKEDVKARKSKEKREDKHRDEDRREREAKEQREDERRAEKERRERQAKEERERREFDVGKILDMDKKNKVSENDIDSWLK